MAGILCVGLALVAHMANGAPTPRIAYSLSMPQPHTHYFQVDIQLEHFEEDTLALQMPVWTPGSYLIRDFAKNVEQFQVLNDEGTPMPSTKIDKNTWSIPTRGHGVINVRYLVYANELSVRTSHLDISHGYINGASVFMYVRGYLHLPATLQIHPYPTWETVTTALPKASGAPFLYKAANYDELADSPIEIGNHQVLTFDAGGAEHTMAIYGPGNYSVKALKKDMGKIIEACVEVFGENPNEHYTFIIHNIDADAAPGLEHTASTTLQVWRWIYAPAQEYERFLSLVAHEYFHLWLVKRIKPANFDTFDYSKENYTSLLWVMEGFTSYYDELLLARTGIISPTEYLDKLLNAAELVHNQPGAYVQPVAEASFDAWIKYYQPNENSLNATISYYKKGTLLAAMLDLDIMHHSRSQYSMDDVLRYLYHEYYKTGSGVTEADIQSALEKFAGHSLDSFFKAYVHGTDTLDMEKYLLYAGVQLQQTHAAPQYQTLGIHTDESASGILVKNVIKGTPAYRAGLNAGDELLAIDTFRIRTTEDMATILNYGNSDSVVKILISRQGILRSIDVQPEPNGEYIFRYRIAPANKLQEKVREAWLGE